MALIQCPECGKNISDLAKSCPNCGYPVQFINTQTNYGEKTYNISVKQEKIKDSTLSIWAAVFAFFTCTIPIGFVLAIIDLQKNDKTTKHTGSWFAIIFALIFFVIIVISVLMKL